MKDKKTTSKPWPFKLPEDGWYHLAPRGEFPGTDDISGEEVIQILGDAEFESILADFRQQAAAENFSGILIDYDHLSKFNDQSTVAAGWIMELQVRDDGLWFRPRWSETGESNVKSGCYRFISPVFGGAKTQNRARPLRLLRAGLTNDPNFKSLRPLSNRAKDNQEPERKEPTMKKLLALLGLAPEASEEAAVEKVQALIDGSADVAELENRATKAEDELKTLKADQLKTKADAFCDTHEALIENREAVHAQFMKDPDGTTALFEGLKDGAGHATIHNRANKQPGKGGDGKKTQKSNADVLEGKVQEYIGSNRCSYDKAFSAVSRAHPELLEETEPKTDD